LSCGKIFKFCSKYPLRKKYCSKKCLDREHYKRHKAEYIAYSSDYQKKNPEKCKVYRRKAMRNFLTNHYERFRELMKKSYEKNKWKHRCRQKTLHIVGMNRSILAKQCKKCGSLSNLEIHHEEYPQTSKEIKKAIEEGKIFYLCKEHHPRGHKKFN